MWNDKQPSSARGPTISKTSTNTAETLAHSFGFEPIEPEAKAEKVRAVFDKVAKRYDLMNDLMSAGVHRLWKEAMVDWLAPRPDRVYLDLAGGTGDIAARILRRIDGQARIYLADINYSMLAVGRDRVLDDGYFGAVHPVTADAQALPFSDASIDACTIAFGMRNVTHIDKALREIRRVLRPGGRFLCLEFSRLTAASLEPLYDRYSFQVLPALGRMVAGDAESYRYLAESIRKFPDQDKFGALIVEAGFSRVKFRNLSAGIACIHSGWRL